MLPLRATQPVGGVVAAPVLTSQRLVLRTLVVAGLAALILLCYWLGQDRFAGYGPLYALLLISIGYKILKVLFEWYHYWAIRHPHTPLPLQRQWTVDVFTTAMPGEPYELIKSTLEAMVAMRYPHTTYLCDEGNDPHLKALCKQLGVRHITREVKVDAKAGNINNALRGATGDICVILDPDHRPEPHLLEVILPYFEDPQIGFVQSVQAYKNSGESAVALGAAQQTYTFYGPLMMGMGSYGTAQAIGANCVFRRSALDSIGGHAPGLSEDMHTAMRLHAKGWKSVYVPQILTRGLVPSNISAYYKQQLKWSRGTFDLLFHVLPKILSGLSWRQRLHYSLVPLHFAAGIIALIDIAIPAAALATGEVPLLLEFSKAYLFLLPFLLMTLLIRQYAQRWLMEPSERGFHLTGGVLLFGTWWVHLTGFVYTLLGVKVPYIPTPKENECTNHWRLGAPNLLVAMLLAGIAAYSLYYDSNPYNRIMAGYALFNALLLLVVFWFGLDRLHRQLEVMLQKVPLLLAPLQKAGAGVLWLAGALSAGMRRYALAGLVLLLTAFGGLSWIAAHPVDPVESAHKKGLGGFYLGLDLAAPKQNLALFTNLQQDRGQAPNLVPFTAYWAAEPASQMPLKLLAEIGDKGAIPFITWLPMAPKGEPRVANAIWTTIKHGKYNALIARYAEQVRSYGRPVFINFAPESDNPALPWHISRQNPLAHYIDAVRHVQVIFLQHGVNNVSWVWNPWKAANIPYMFPGDGFADWVGISTVHRAGGDKGNSFADRFRPFHHKLLPLRKPVVLTSFKMETGAEGRQWLAGFAASRAIFPELSGVIVKPVPTTGQVLPVSGPSWQYQNMVAGLTGSLPRLADVRNRAVPPLPAGLPVRSKGSLQEKDGQFQLLVGGKPFYVKGVAYNPEQSWRDGFHPLTRRKLEADFAAIKAMGANTIRRYAPSASDRNILNVARSKGLKVMYGFWFDPKINYAQDKRKVAAYIRQVEKEVARLKDDSTILVWNIGNESSGLLKHHFAQPYLTVVRRAYMEMIETMARKVHALDPQRPVLTSLEHSHQLPGELYGFANTAPSVDVVSVNSYYKNWIGQVHEMMHRFNPGRPYMVTEFGPKGYWETLLNDMDQQERLSEQSDKHKALLFTSEWTEDIAGHRGCNLGGVAYCWQERYEGTATWYGITDHKGRKKPVYYSLQHLWRGTPEPRLHNLFISGPGFTVKPGGTYEFTAVSDGAIIESYHWQLLSGDYLLEAGKLRTGNKANTIIVTLPREGRNYRLYVYAQIAGNRVMTASKPITIYQGVYNEGI